MDMFGPSLGGNVHKFIFPFSLTPWSFSPLASQLPATQTLRDQKAALSPSQARHIGPRLGSCGAHSLSPEHTTFANDLAKSHSSSHWEVTKRTGKPRQRRMKPRLIPTCSPAARCPASLTATHAAPHRARNKLRPPADTHNSSGPDSKHALS